jgi:hypothetical protein
MHIYQLLFFTVFVEDLDLFFFGSYFCLGPTSLCLVIIGLPKKASRRGCLPLLIEFYSY